MSVSELDGFNFTMARFKAVWEDPDTGAGTLVGSAPVILWPDKTTTVPRGMPFVKLVWTVTAKKRRNLGNPAWYVYNGLFSAIILEPLASQNDQLIKQLSEIIKTGFQGVREDQDYYYRETIARPYPVFEGFRQYRTEVKFEGNERV